MDGSPARIVKFDFTGQADGLPYVSLSQQEQDKFKAAFLAEADKVEAWFRRHAWLASPPPSRIPFGSYAAPGMFGLSGADFRVHVSNTYRISRALAPAALDQRGRMEFAAAQAIAGTAAIAHELVHVYFPNGNRLLAEGLAVYLQQAIGSNPAFPNWGVDLHKLVRDVVRGIGVGVEDIHIRNLDVISTPDSLRLRIKQRWYESYECYVIGGSFIQFLIERHGLDKFHALYMKTPLIPWERNGGDIERWTEVYAHSLLDLEQQWKASVAEAPLR